MSKSKEAIEGLIEWGDAKENLAKAIRSIAFLLDWSSDAGNEPMCGHAASGLVYLLHECAEGTERLYTQDEALIAGADPEKLFADRRTPAAPSEPLAALETVLAPKPAPTRKPARKAAA